MVQFVWMRLGASASRARHCSKSGVGVLRLRLSEVRRSRKPFDPRWCSVLVPDNARCGVVVRCGDVSRLSINECLPRWDRIHSIKNEWDENSRRGIGEIKDEKTEMRELPRNIVWMDGAWRGSDRGDSDSHAGRVGGVPWAVAVFRVAVAPRPPVAAPR